MKRCLSGDDLKEHDTEEIDLSKIIAARHMQQHTDEQQDSQAEIETYLFSDFERQVKNLPRRKRGKRK